MKKFVLLYIGSRRQPTPDMMEKWTKWFGALGERIVDSGNPLGPGKEITQSGTEALPQSSEEILGYSIINAESVEEVEKLRKDCPADNLRVYEALPM
jgi:hypothetical protein